MWPDGTVQWLSGAGRIRLGEDGEPVRGVGISQNVTERKRAEAEFTRLNDEIQLQRLRVFKATMRTVQDIVNNLLNGLQLVRLEAGSQLPAEMLTLIDQMIQEASVKLRALGDLETVKEREMAVGLGIDYPGSSLRSKTVKESSLGAFLLVPVFCHCRIQPLSIPATESCQSMRPYRGAHTAGSSWTANSVSIDCVWRRWEHEVLT